MTTRLTEIPQGTVADFRGGLNTASPATLIAMNQAMDLRNVFITPGGGLEKRRGNETFNSVAMNSGANVQGIGYYKQNTGSKLEFLIAITGDKIFKSDALDGTMDDITGGLTITDGVNNIWTHTVMNDLSIFVGGPDGTPDAPIKFTGTGNAALLGGSPPSGSFGFTANNRMFIGSTSADPSQIKWSGLAAPEDWSGVSSGSQDIRTNDGDKLVSWAVLNTDVVLLFKENSIHQFIIREEPFPVFTLFEDNGAAGKDSVVVADGLVYFITPNKRMRITDGVQIISDKDIPNLGAIDDIWDTTVSSLLHTTHGFRYTGKDFDHIVWIVTTSGNSVHDTALIWDLTNKCWLKHTTGYQANVATITQMGTLYTGHFDGKIYEQDVADDYSDASETTGTIDALWRSGWNTQGSLQESVRPFRLNVTLQTQGSGLLIIMYGFDFTEDSRYLEVSMTAGGAIWNAFEWGDAIWSGRDEIIRHIFLRGRGNAFQLVFKNAEDDVKFRIHGYSISGSRAGQKLFQVA